MCSMLSYMSVLTLLVVDVRTGALQHLGGSPFDCHVCVPGNKTTCEQSSVEWPSIKCPVDIPFCATTAFAPNFRSSLTCSAALKSACALTYSSQNTLTLNCVCTERLCNVPFTRKLRNELLNFSSKKNNSISQTESFLKMILSNITDGSLYKRITVDMSETNKIPLRNKSQVTTTFSSVSLTVENSSSFSSDFRIHPRVEALKQEQTALSDDDEDESEGSGLYEETKTHSQSVSAPAAPSSFLPADDNNALKLIYNFYLTTYLIVYIIILK